MWRLQADHGRKHETGGEMVIRGLDIKRPITEAVTVIEVVAEGGSRVRISASVSPELAAAVVKALAGR